MNQIKTKKISRIVFFIMLWMLLGLCFLRYAFQVNIPRPLLMVVAILIALFGDRDEIVSLWISCIPLYMSLNYTYVLLISLLIYVIKFRRHILLDFSALLIILMILWELLHCFNGPFSPTGFLNNCLPLLLLAVLMSDLTHDFDYDLIVRVFAMCTVAVCINLLGRLLFFTNFNIARALANLQRLGTSTMNESQLISGGDMNPNSLGVMCVLAVTGLSQIRNACRSKYSDRVMMLFLLIFGALTSSRTYLACAIIMAVLLILSQEGSLSGKLLFALSVLLAMILVLVLTYLLFPQLMQYYIGRFFVDDITTGRLDLLTIYHNFIISDTKIMFFGIGQYGFGTKLIEEYQIYNVVPHNGIQELIIAWGIQGVGLFLILLITMLVHSKMWIGRLKLLNMIPLLIILAKVQVGQMLTSPYTMLTFSYAYLSLCTDLSPSRKTMDIFSRPSHSARKRDKYKINKEENK